MKRYADKFYLLTLATLGQHSSSTSATSFTSFNSATSFTSFNSCTSFFNSYSTPSPSGHPVWAQESCGPDVP